MASTSTNKQPLMQDRVLHEIADLTGSTIEEASRIDITGSNSATLVLDCTQNDGAILSEIYAQCRATTVPYNVCLYMSTANDFLRNSQAKFIGVFRAGGTLPDLEADPSGDTLSTEAFEGEKVVYDGLPFVLAPVPGVGSEDANRVIGTQFQALYVPKGRTLWAAVNKQSPTDQAVEAPLVGVQGGYF